jgi:hypothetical protein
MSLQVGDAIEEQGQPSPTTDWSNLLICGGRRRAARKKSCRRHPSRHY